MEINPVRAALIAAVAPVAWGTTYIVTENFLPPDRPMFSALVRALPVGILLLAWRRELPHGSWWWKSALTGMCTIGLFFPLLFLSAYHLPGGLAGTVQALSPLAVMALAWPLIGERPAPMRVLAALVGVAGVMLLVLRGPGDLSPLGLFGAFGSMLISAVGFVLVKRWPAPTDMLTYVSWQLVASGFFLLPLALLLEGPPPPIDLPAALGYAWVAIAGTGVAYLCWFTGLRHLPAGAVSLIGLVNPVVATSLGVLFMSEAFGWTQALGAALVLGGVLAGQRVGPRTSRRAAESAEQVLAGEGVPGPVPPHADLEHCAGRG